MATLALAGFTVRRRNKMNIGMDWAVFSREAMEAERRGIVSLRAFFADHGVTENPALRHTLDALQRRTTLGGFMQTSAGTASDDAPGLEPGERLGVWRIEDRIGSGGMGAVYRVVRDDGKYEQRAALKLVASTDPEASARFDRERANLALLEHQGISRIIDGDTTDDGRPFMVVELVEGPPIDAHVRDNHLASTAIVGLLVELLAAVAYAHKRLVLHRDIKADNVLVDETGRVRLIDFGVAGLLDTEQQAAGPLTIAYAAPELFAAGRLTVSADLFAVGILAHELFARHLPARDPEGGAIVANEDIRQSDLAAVLRKATAAEPDQRYASAEAFAEDLQAFVELRPVAAQQGGSAYRAKKFIRRNPIGAALAAGLVVALAGGMAGTSLMAARADAEADRANAARARAEYALDKAQRNSRVQEAYGDALHRAFGGEGNTKRMTDIVLGRAAEAFALRAEDPRRAAEITFAVGRNFVERNDYKTAQEVLQPWIDEGFGDPALLVEGKLNLALALRYQGDLKKAKLLFEEVAKHYTGTPDDGSYEHLLALVQFTTMSRDDALIASTTRRLEEALERGGTVEERALYLSSVSQLRRITGDFPGAEAATSAVHELLNANPLVEIAGREAILVNKAMYATFVSQTNDTARKDIETLITQLTQKKGESSLLAYAYELSSAIALHQKDFDRAIADGETAAAVAKRISGEGSSFHLGTSAALVEAHVAAGADVKAKEILDRLAPLVAATSAGKDTRVALAKAYYLAAFDSPEAASAWLSEAGITRWLTNRTPLYQFRMSRLERLGVKPAPAED